MNSETTENVETGTMISSTKLASLYRDIAGLGVVLTDIFVLHHHVFGGVAILVIAVNCMDNSSD